MSAADGEAVHMCDVTKEVRVKCEPMLVVDADRFLSDYCDGCACDDVA